MREVANLGKSRRAEVGWCFDRYGGEATVDARLSDELLV